MKRVTGMLAITGVLVAACDGSRASDDPAINAVAARLQPNEYSIDAADLRVRENSKGAGTFVYVPEPQAKTLGTVNLLWLVLDGQAYALNGPSKEITPALPWPRDAAPDAWKRTGLNPYTATDAIEMLFSR